MREILEIVGFTVAAGLGACFVAFMGGVGFGAGLAASGWTPRHTKAPKIRVTADPARPREDLRPDMGLGRR